MACNLGNCGRGDYRYHRWCFLFSYHAGWSHAGCVCRSLGRVSEAPDEEQQAQSLGQCLGHSGVMGLEGLGSLVIGLIKLNVFVGEDRGEYRYPK